MSMAYTGLLLLIVAIVVAMRLAAGLWSNLIALVNVVVAGLLAMSFFEPLASALASVAPFMSDYLDIVVLWSLFAGAVFLLKAFTDRASLVRVKFAKPVETAGNFAVLGLMGWIVMCFTAASIHTAPLGRNALWDGFRPESPALFGIYPDRLWLGFVQRASQGTVAGDQVFDQKGDFLVRYAARREAFQRPQAVAGGS